MKKLFGGIRLTWKKLIVFAVIMGVYTALMAILPQVRYTSFNTITATLEVWIFIGILIIMNARSPKDAALKCFVFFLISQPLVYLLQVPFSWQGWGLFRYYGFWFVLTVLCLPMGYVGYFIKKDKWWGYLILLPMILLTAGSYGSYLRLFPFYAPRYLLISLFCAGAMILYPLALFRDNRIRTVGAAISGAILVGLTVLVLLNPYTYSTELTGSINGKPVTKDCKVSLKDDTYGDVSIRYVDSLGEYMIHADFKRAGKTVLTVETPEGETTEYDLTIEMNTYTINEIHQ